MNKEFIEFRHCLLGLHKTLLDYQKSVYEGQHGKISSPGIMLGLVMENNSFAWLRRFSELVVGIDELLESKEEVPQEKFKDLLVYSKKLLSPAKDGSEFEKNYYDAIQHHPAAALAHGKTLAALENIKT